MPRHYNEVPARPAELPPTERLYWQADDLFEADAAILAARADALAFDRTVFYPGGGGQPSDEGTVSLADGPRLAVVSLRADEDGVIWHITRPAPPPGCAGGTARLSVDGARRLALARYHTVLHVLNTIALRDYGGWITGAQIAVDYARIDFNFEGLSPALTAELEAKVNAVLSAGRRLRAYSLPEAEFEKRGDLRRTLTAKPPVVAGRVRVVEIEGFEAQACGGTHVARTSEVGHFSIYKTENKGRLNKRLYVRLAA
jgi:misacylated tRNA(Ala) deacylase